MPTARRFPDFGRRTKYGGIPTFTTTKYRIEYMNGRPTAIAIAPSGKKIYQYIPATL